MRIFILANGNATRWNRAYGVDKQLLEIDGEKLLHRTVRLLLENNLKDVYIIGRYKVAGAKNYIPNFDSIIGKFDCTRELWNDIDSFALLYGDCYYSDEIIKDLAKRKTNKKWLHWCCNRPNKITGKTWEEGYIHAIYDVKWWEDKCIDLHKEIDEGKIKYDKDWIFVRYLLDIDLYKHQPDLMKDYEVDWEDETDDFDYSIDYRRWLKNCRGIVIKDINEEVESLKNELSLLKEKYDNDYTNVKNNTKQIKINKKNIKKLDEEKQKIKNETNSLRLGLEAIVNSKRWRLLDKVFKKINAIFNKR